MVCLFPLRVNDWPFTNLHNAVARHEADFAGGVNEFYVRPLIPVMVNVVRDLAEQNAFALQYAMGFAKERWEGVSESIVIFLR